MIYKYLLLLPLFGCDITRKYINKMWGFLFIMGIGRVVGQCINWVAPPVLYAYRETYSETAHSNGQPFTGYVIEPSLRSVIQTGRGMSYYPGMKGDGTTEEQRKRALQDFIIALEQEKVGGARVFIKRLPPNKTPYETITITTDVPEPIEAIVTRGSARNFLMGVVPDLIPSQKYLWIKKF